MNLPAFIAKVLSVSLLTLCLYTQASASDGRGAQASANIEICFVLDTTGSMSGLIQGAKDKIWAIATAIISLKPTPDIKFCLIGYRDRGDAYITRVTGLTGDIDEIYRHLLAFKASGGGDGPESVNQALYESVNDIGWTLNDPSIIRTIYLVGDFPPHMDYANDIPYPQTITQANLNDIVINTVQCGNHAATTPIWQEIAAKTNGTYSRIAQHGNVRVVTTPMDQDLVALNHKLGLTLMLYGTELTQSRILEAQQRSESASDAVVADRLGYFNKLEKVTRGKGDLIDDLDSGLVTLQELKENQLPEVLQALNHEQRRHRIKQISSERKEYSRVIKALVEERQQYITNKSQAEESSFDSEVIKSIKNLALQKGFKFD